MVFTGAGISTESGIPDFRSPGGVWSRMKPIYFQDFVSDPAKRREAWERAFSGRAGWVGPRAQRRPRGGRAPGRPGQGDPVITQNVDNLHQASGVPADQVIELHGNASYATCLECAERHELDELKESFLKAGEIPYCRRCGGLVKTATISFGQAMPAEPMARAEAATLDCDAFLVLGSSLVVHPAAGFPLLAKRNGREPGHRQPRAHRPGRLRRPRAARRDRPGHDRRGAGQLAAISARPRETAAAARPKAGRSRRRARRPAALAQRPGLKARVQPRCVLHHRAAALQLGLQLRAAHGRRLRPSPPRPGRGRARAR